MSSTIEFLTGVEDAFVYASEAMHNLIEMYQLCTGSYGICDVLYGDMKHGVMELLASLETVRDLTNPRPSDIDAVADAAMKLAKVSEDIMRDDDDTGDDDGDIGDDYDPEDDEESPVDEHPADNCYRVTPPEPDISDNVTALNWIGWRRIDGEGNETLPEFNSVRIKAGRWLTDADAKRVYEATAHALTTHVKRKLSNPETETAEVPRNYDVMQDGQNTVVEFDYSPSTLSPLEPDYELVFTNAVVCIVNGYVIYGNVLAKGIGHTMVDFYVR